MKVFIVGIFILFMAVNCFASIDSLGGFSFTTITKTDSTVSDDIETDTVVWTPASGNRIKLMGVKFNSSNATTLLVESGTTAVIPTTECTASGQVVVSSSVPIWEGAADATLTYTVPTTGRHSILMWGYEVD